MRRDTSIESCSLYGAGALRSKLSTKRMTSATLRAGRAVLPAKITSSISAPRSDVGRVSPMTQRSASKRLDLPQPFGPTIAVSPGSIRSSVGSTKDLNPESLRRVNFTRSAPPRRCWGLLFLLQQAVQVILKSLPVAGELLHLTVDHEARHALNAVFAGRFVADLADPLRHFLVCDATVHLFRTHSGDSAQLDKAGVHVGNLILWIPLHLIPPEKIKEGEIVIRRKAARHGFGGDIGGVERKHAQDVTDLAGVDVFLLKERKIVHVEMRAVRAGGRGILDDQDGCFRR